MVQGQPANLMRPELLYDVTLSGAQAAGATNIQIGNETNNDRVINRGEWAEIKWLEVISPIVAGTGAGDHIAAIRPYIDGAQLRGNDKVIIRCDLDNNQAFAPTQLDREIKTGGVNYIRSFHGLGLCLPELLQLGVQNDPSLLLKNFTLKTKENGKINFAVDIDTGGTSANIEVRAWGYRYKGKDLLNQLIQSVYGQGEGRRIEMRDPVSNRDFSFNLSPKYLDADHFDYLPGGNNQTLNGGVQVDRFWRWARNAVATTPNQEYDMQADNGNVATSDQGLSDPFQYKNGIPADTLIMYDKIGLNPHANHLQLKLQVNQQYVYREWLTAGINHHSFGRTTGIGPTVAFADHRYDSVPVLPQPVFASGEQLKVIVVDNGSAIAAGTTFGAGDLIVASGLRIISPEYSGLKPQPLGNTG